MPSLPFYKGNFYDNFSLENKNYPFKRLCAFFDIKQKDFYNWGLSQGTISNYSRLETLDKIKYYMFLLICLEYSTYEGFSERIIEKIRELDNEKNKRGE